MALFRAIFIPFSHFRANFLALSAPKLVSSGLPHELLHRKRFHGINRNSSILLYNCFTLPKLKKKKKIGMVMALLGTTTFRNYDILKLINLKSASQLFCQLIIFSSFCIRYTYWKPHFMSSNIIFFCSKNRNACFSRLAAAPKTPTFLFRSF